MLTLTSPVEIWAHRLPAGAKLAVLCAATAGLFWLSGPVALGLAGVAVAGLVGSGGVRFAAVSLRQLRPLVPFVVIVGLWHWWTADVAQGAAIVLRMAAAVALANFVTMTTRLSDMIATLTTLARPLAAFGLQPRTFALAIALVIRFIPAMTDRWQHLSDAFRARARGRAGWRLLAPAAMAALDDADQVADALRARGGAG